MGMFDDDGLAPAATPRARPASAPDAPRANMFDDVQNAPASALAPPARAPARPGDHPSSYGELKAADPDWTQWAKWKLQEGLQGAGFLPQHAQHFSSGMVDAAQLAPPVGGALAGLNMDYYGSRGQLGRAAIESLGVIPVGALWNRIRKGLPTRSLADIPSERELHAVSRGGYDYVDNAPVLFNPRALPDASSAIAQQVAQRYHPTNAPATFGFLEDAPNIGRTMPGQPGQSRVFSTPRDFAALRQQLRDIPFSPANSDSEAARTALNYLDAYVAHPPAAHVASAPPGELDRVARAIEDARGNWAARKRSQTVTTPAANADIKAELGRNLDTVTNNWLANLQATQAGQRKLAGFTGQERASLREAGRGDPATRAMQGTADVLGNWGTKAATGLGGVGSAVAAVMHGMDPGSATALAAMPAATAMLGSKALHGWAGARQQRAIETLAEDLRKRSPLYQHRVAMENAQGGPPVAPGVLGREAVVYALTPAARAQAAEGYDKLKTPYEYEQD